MNAADALTQMQEQTDLTVVIISMALLVSRILPVLIFSPFLGGETIPAELKIGLGIMLGIVMFPTIESHISQIPTGSIMVILLFLKEVFVGIALAFIVSLVFTAAEIAGTLVDTFSGTTMAQLMVPQLQQQVSLYSNLQINLSVVLFITLNGHHVVIEALSDSFLVVPLEGFPQFSMGVWPFFSLVIDVFGELFRIALTLSAPALLVSLLCDLGLGMINRVAPQIQVYFISMSIKPLAAALVMLSAIHVIVGRFETEFRVMTRYLSQALRLLG